MAINKLSRHRTRKVLIRFFFNTTSCRKIGPQFTCSPDEGIKLSHFFFYFFFLLRFFSYKNLTEFVARRLRSSTEMKQNFENKIHRNNTFWSPPKQVVSLSYGPQNPTYFTRIRTLHYFPTDFPLPVLFRSFL